MAEPCTHELILRGRVRTHLLRPILHDFSVCYSPTGTTILTGAIREAAHLHGVVIHLTSLGLELISLNPR